MGLDHGINKIKGYKYNSRDDMEYGDWNYTDCEEVYYWRKHYWLNYYFPSDGSIITKEFLIKFKKYCEDIINSDIDVEIFNLKFNDFYCCQHLEKYKNDIQIKNAIIIEIKEVIEQIDELLKEDFYSDTFYYWN